MIWATVSSRSYFCWLNIASPSLAAKNIINLILVLTIWWCPICKVMSYVVERGYLLWPVRSLGKTLLAFALLHVVLQGQTCLLFQVFLDFLLLHSSPIWWKSKVTQSCPTLCDPMGYSLPCSSVHGIFQARVLEWVAISFSRVWWKGYLFLVLVLEDIL